MFNSTLFHSQNRLTLPKSKGFGRLYNWYAASSRSYGMLYNWYAATDVRNIAPVGWHVPSKAEYDTLIAYLGGSTVAGGKLKETGITYWDSPNTGATNETGFNAIGNGYRYPGSGELKVSAYFLTTTLNTTVCSYLQLLNNNSTAITYNNSQLTRGMAIRLVKDDTTDTGIMTGNDGKQYSTVKIGTQVWMSENLEETKFRNGDIIPVVTDTAAWVSLTTAGSCWYNNTRTYNLAPVGWHLPNTMEYDTLTAYLGGSDVVGGMLRETGLIHWNYPNTDATNESGFTAIGGGYRDNTFNNIKNINSLYATDAILNIVFNSTDTSLNNIVSNLFIGRSIRFIRNKNSILTTQPVDTEGNVYETIIIGAQEFTKQNNKSKKWRTGESINIQDVYTDVQWPGLTIPACCAYNNDENNV